MDDALHAVIPDPLDASDVEQLKGRKISRKLLINKLNYINFQDGSILVHFTHRRYNITKTVSAAPQPCLKNMVNCLWNDPIEANTFEECTVTGFSLNEGHAMIFVPARTQALDKRGIDFLLPESCYEYNQRKNPRHFPKRMTAKLLQNGTTFEASLSDFSVFSFRVAIPAASTQNLQWLNPELPVTVVLSNDKEIVYSGECLALKRDRTPEEALVLKPINNQMSRFKSKRYRSKRQYFVPSPNAIFQHPITGVNTNLKVLDISGSGLSVTEEYRYAALLPGMIIPKLEISFANTMSLICKAQVLYRNQIQENGCSLFKCGLVILDIPLHDHIKLLALITQADDSHTYMSSKVDSEALWQFFFETGFIYPEKYKQIIKYKDDVKALYQKLYEENPSFARHFTYRKNGKVVAHIAMVRFYENSWFIHHHAADNFESKKAGIAVLRQISNSINNCHNMSSVNMQHVLCYYRPDNKFPHRVFGGLARNLKQPKGCSLDTFAYILYKRTFSMNCTLAENWTLTKAGRGDLNELKLFYENASGGLMLTALDMEGERAASDGVVSAYRNLGLQREKHIFAIKKQGRLKAICMVNIADIGINMSELTSCIKVIVIDAEELEAEYFNLALLLLSTKFQQQEIPVLVYPVSYAQRQSIPYEKLYTLWVLNLQYLDQYFNYCDPFFRTT